MAIAGLKQERIWFGLLGRKVTANLDSILKSRDIILPTKIHLVKAMVFPTEDEMVGWHHRLNGHEFQ